MHRSVAVVLALAAATGCASAAEPAPCALVPAASPPASDRVAVSWLILPSRDEMPVATAWIDGEGARVVLDTGANHHFIERSVAWWLHLPPYRVDGGPEWVLVHDAAGLEIASEPFGPIELRLGLRGADRATLVLSTPMSPLVDAGLAGMVSPQRLTADGGAIELDLPAGELRAVGAEALDRALGPTRTGWTALRPICATTDGVALFAVDVAVDGETRSLLVDTGSASTAILAGTPLGASLAARATERLVYSTLGRDQEAPTVRGVPVAVAGGRFDATVHVVEQETWGGGCSDHGALGIDVLRRCRLILARDRGAIACGGGS